MIKTVLILLVIITLYILATFYSYKYTQAAHSKGGEWERLDPSGDDLFTTFMPFLNVLFAIDYLTGNCYKYKSTKNLNKFYKINKGDK